MKKLFEKDKKTHFAVCFAISVVACLVSVGIGGRFYVSATEGIIVAMAAGCGKEFGDLMNGGKWDWWDIAADFFGALCGAMLHVGLMFCIRGTIGW